MLRKRAAVVLAQLPEGFAGWAHVGKIERRVAKNFGKLLEKLAFVNQPLRKLDCFGGLIVRNGRNCLNVWIAVIALRLELTPDSIDQFAVTGIAIRPPPIESAEVDQEMFGLFFASMCEDGLGV